MKLYSLTSSLIKQLFVFKLSDLKDSKALLFSLIYLALVILLSNYFFIDLVQFFKTVANLIDPSIDGNQYLWLSIVLFAFSLIYVFLKSLLETLLKILLRNKIQVIQFKASLVCFFVVSVIIATSVLACSNKVNSEFNKSSLDIRTIQNIDKLALTNNVDYKLYVSKVPYLYQKANLKVEPYVLSFDGIALKNEEQLVVTRPNDPHFFLIAHGYKFCKISDNTAFFVKGDKLETTLENAGFILTDYYFKKSINLKKLAKLNHLKFTEDKSIYIESTKKSIKKTELEYLIKGNYLIKLELAYNHEINNEDLATFKLTASNKQITIYTTSINKNACTDNKCKLIIPLEIKENYHGVEFLVEPLNNNSLYLSQLEYSKLQN